MKRVVLYLFLALCLQISADVRVTGTGRGAGNGAIAREQALSDALRDAVRKGTGVNLISRAGTNNFILEYDRIFTRAFGYVKNYKIIESYIDNAGLYTIKIDAEVAAGPSELEDRMAVKQIIELKGSPRLAILVNGEIEGIGNSCDLISGLLHEIAVEYGFNSVRVDYLESAEKRRAGRDELVGKEKAAGYHRSGAQAKYDFVLEVAANGTYSGPKKLFGIDSQQFSLSADLGAITPEGRVIVQLAMPGRDFEITRISGSGDAARAALKRYLGGEEGKNFRALLIRLLAVWVTELDAGTNTTVEISGLSHAECDKIKERLSQEAGIEAVALRNFDARFGAVLDVRSRLDSGTLSGLIRKLSPRLNVERCSSDYIQMSASSPLYASWKPAVIILLSAGAASLLLAGIFRKRKIS